MVTAMFWFAITNHIPCSVKHVLASIRTHWSRNLHSWRVGKRYGVGLANSQLDPCALIHILREELLSKLFDKPR